MNTKALITSGGSRKGLLLIAERLGALLIDDGTLQDLAKGLTGTLPEYRDDYAWGIRDALLEMLCSAEANRLNRTIRAPCNCRDSNCNWCWGAEAGG